MLTNDIYDYYNVSQGKITIPGMDDGEEFQLTDVSRLLVSGRGTGAATGRWKVWKFLMVTLTMYMQLMKFS